MSTIGSSVRCIGIPQVFGGMYWTPVDHKGPSSYTRGGYLLDPKAFGFDNTIWSVAPAVDQSGAYMAVGRALNRGFSPFHLVWINLATGEEVGAGTDLSAIIVRLAAIGQ